MSARGSFLKRGLVAGVWAVATAVAAQSCGFPDHSFIDDDEFYGKKKDGSVGSTGGSDASTTGSGGSQSGGGASNSGGAAGSGGTGTADASTGGTGAGGITNTGGSEAGVIGRGDGSTPRPDAAAGGGTGAGGSPPGDSGSPEAAVEAGLVCDPGLSNCSGTCVDFQTDNKNCGGCGSPCSANELCTAGQCQPPCDPGLTLCSGACVDLQTDKTHCGACNNAACLPGNVCEGGACVTDCGALTRCGPGICADLTSDDAHCGTCGTNCKTIGQVCSNSQCQANCAFPFTACGVTCANLTNDPLNCKTCGNKCGTGEACINSVCTKLVENCQNGTDDDGDKLIDCDDPDCGNFTCAPALAGWTGPVAVWSGTSGAAPSCSTSGGFSTSFLSASAGLIVPPYTCPTCNCTPSVGMSCTTMKFIFDDTTDCVKDFPWSPFGLPPTSSCSSFSLLQANPSARSIHLSTNTTDGWPYVSGTCSASQATPVFPPVTWSTDVVGCAAPPSSAANCSVTAAHPSGGECLPKPAAPFGAQLCVFKFGIAACPADYPVQSPGAGEQYYQTVSEGRSCSSCSCTPECSKGTLTLYTDSSCSAGATQVTLSPPTACTTIPADPTQSGNADTRSYTFTNAGAACGATPSTLSGAPIPQNPVTVCCQAP